MTATERDPSTHAVAMGGDGAAERERAWRADDSTPTLVLLALANVIVANAVAHHLGWGGLRTPSSAANLWIPFVVVLLPVLHGSWRRSCRRHGAGVKAVVGATADGAGVLLLAMPFGLLALAGMVLVAAVAGEGLRRLGLPDLASKAAVTAWKSALPLLALVLAAGLVAFRRWPRVAARIRVAACVPPLLLLSVLSFLVVLTPRAWVGEDAGAEVLQQVSRDHRRYDAVRTMGPSFHAFVMWVMEATPIVPGVLEWSRSVAGPQRASGADLEVRGDVLVVTFDEAHGSERVAVPLR